MLVSNGGYGTVQQSLVKGVPMVLSGVSQDKAQTGPIAEWAGVGIYLQVEQTTPEMIRESVDAILRDEKYKERAAELATKYRDYDTIAIVDQTIQEALK